MDVREKKVLIFGDSLSHRGGRSSPVVFDVREGSQRTSSVPGDLLASHILEAGAAAVRVNAKVSRSAWNFFRVEDGNALLQNDQLWKPNIVIVLLGTNDLGLNMALDEQAMATIRNAYMNVGADVWAVGPPSFASYDLTNKTPAVVEMMKRVFGANRFVDGRPLTSDLIHVGRSGDGTHFTSSGAKLFAARIATTLGIGIPSTGLPSQPTTKPLPSSQEASSAAGRVFSVGLGMGGVAIALALGFRWIVRRRQRQLSSSST